MTQRISAHHRRLLRIIGIEQEIRALEKRGFMAVEHAPLNEKGTFIAAQNIFINVICPPVAQFSTAKTLLNFPASEIGINQHITRMN
ncbi:hypothetical protein D3C75_647140 [compost metagenome]